MSMVRLKGGRGDEFPFAVVVDFTFSPSEPTAFADAHAVAGTYLNALPLGVE
jgi:hypothetical protein